MITAPNVVGGRDQPAVRAEGRVGEAPFVLAEDVQQLAVGDVPNAGRPVFARRQNVTTVRAEDDSREGAVVAAQHQRLVDVAGVPEHRRRVATGRGDEATVLRAEGRAHDGVVVAAQDFEGVRDGLVQLPHDFDLARQLDVEPVDLLVLLPQRPQRLDEFEALLDHEEQKYHQDEQRDAHEP